ncbi:hypothetical protein [Candidatus Solirubrobacter pratensis]|uniref:hypothetical protein n=1 Tax=Candidatus Solirubrobacter pratensis TaxID=1298857 RepID=UPI000424E6EB|nr:hypothetical protein [Candidatus Solirubrobacter pratensis]
MELDSRVYAAFIRSRANNADKALRQFESFEIFEEEAGITDLIADLLHLAEAHGFEADSIMRSAEMHYHCDGGAGHEPDDVAENQAAMWHAAQTSACLRASTGQSTSCSTTA